MVLPSSALRNCCSYHLTSSLPHFSQVCLIVAVVFTSPSSIVCTSERFERSEEGKADGLLRVVMDLAEVSAVRMRQ